METTTETNLDVAKTIAAQIGGRAFYMMGTRYKAGDSKSLVFDIRGSKAYNKIKVVLTSMDTYNVTFYKLRSFKVLAEETVEGVYADMLKPIIESKTGLALSLNI